MFATIFFAVLAAAYVPEYSTLATRAAEQHGRGAYQIEQEVTLRKGNEAYTVKETWAVLGESSQRLTLEGRGPLKGLVGGTAVYESSAKYFAEPGQSVRSQRLGEDWLEPLFLFHSSRWFRARLNSLRVTTADATKDRPPLPSEGDLNYEVPPFIRLSRAGGGVAWAIGARPSDKNETRPTLWLEQDQFVVRKFRGADQTIVKADEYTKFDEGLWFPRTRAYTFGPYTVTTQVVTVRTLGKLTSADARFKAASLNPARDALKLPDVDGLREFYARFR